MLVGVFQLRVEVGHDDVAVIYEADEIYRDMQSDVLNILSETTVT